MKGFVRLALRSEGDWWKAYLAKPDTMVGAVLIASIRLNMVVDNPKLKEAFMDMVKASMEWSVRQWGEGIIEEWNDPIVAPESERSGNA